MVCACQGCVSQACVSKYAQEQSQGCAPAQNGGVRACQGCVSQACVSSYAQEQSRGLFPRLFLHTMRVKDVCPGMRKTKSEDMYPRIHKNRVKDVCRSMIRKKFEDVCPRMLLARPSRSLMENSTNTNNINKGSERNMGESIQGLGLGI
jgi:hypothetical protein